MAIILQITTSGGSGSLAQKTTQSVPLRRTTKPEPLADAPDILLISLIIIGSGLLGGWLNFLRTDGSAAVPGAMNKNYIILCLVSGVVACMMVPLFLKTIQSDLLTPHEVTAYSYFILTGLCLIAAIFSNAFIDTLSKRIIDQINTKVTAVEAKTDANSYSVNTAVKQANSAQHTAQTANKKIKPIINALTDQKIGNSVNSTVKESLPASSELESFQANSQNFNLETIILQSGFLFRSAENVAYETGKPIKEVLEKFNKLVSENKVELVSAEPDKHIFAIKSM